MRLLFGSWKRIAIVHDSVPRVPENSLRTYLEVLANVVEDRKRNADQHEVVVVFPVMLSCASMALLK
jgi:hypothetical protein